MNKLRRYLANMSMASLALMAPSGAALADSVDMNTTGPDSNNQATITNVNTVIENNFNNVVVINSNAQAAVTGDVNANDNTTVGGLGSGAASNQSSASTNIVIGNAGAGGMGAGPGGGGAGGSGAGGLGAGGFGVGGSGAGGFGAGGFGAGGMLPEVGASVPMDVSALRALYNPFGDAPLTELAKQNSGLSILFLAVASLMSLLGAAGTALYARRQELKA